MSQTTRLPFISPSRSRITSRSVPAGGRRGPLGTSTQIGGVESGTFSCKGGEIDLWHWMLLSLKTHCDHLYQIVDSSCRFVHTHVRETRWYASIAPGSTFLDITTT